MKRSEFDRLRDECREDLLVCLASKTISHYGVEKGDIILVFKDGVKINVRTEQSVNIYPVSALRYKFTASLIHDGYENPPYKTVKRTFLEFITVRGIKI